MTDDIERAEVMKTMRFQEGKTLQFIASVYGISRERVRQILGNSGTINWTRKFEKRKDFIADNPNLTNSEISEIIKIPTTLVAHFRFGARHKISGGMVLAGANGENVVSEILNNLGIVHKLMPHKHSFDILLDNGKRVDVKSAYKESHPPSIYSPMYKFHIRKNQADIYICIIFRENTNDVFVIPAEEAPSNANIAFSWPPKNKRSKYAKYHNKFDLLK